MNAALAVHGLVAGYDGVEVVHGIDFEVAPGEIFALLGANGAGKTTTLLAISGLVPRSAGTISVAGTPVESSRRRSGDVWRLARRGVAHVPEDRGLFFDLTPREHIRLGRRRGHPSVALAQLVEWFPPLGPVVDRKAGLLSGGEQQMVALASAIAHHPELLLVDEMSLGLAPVIVQRLLPVLRSIADETGTAMVLVEQHVSLVLQVADHGAVLSGGRVVASGTADELQAARATLEAGYLGDVADPGATR